MTALIVLLTFILLGCGAQFRSPAESTRTTEEKRKAAPKVLVPPPTPSVSSEAQTPTAETAPLPSRLEIPPDPVFGAKRIVVLSKESLANAPHPHQVLERITVRDVSQGGFSKQEALEALKYEAFRRFGEKAKGLTDVEYQEKTSVVPGTVRYLQASGTVITW